MNRWPGSRLALLYIGIGLLTGLVAGLFGVGGGAIIVPLLVIAAHFDQRRASGTSLAAIVPTAVVAAITYAARGEVNWLAAIILIVMAVIGAQIGTWLLPRIPVAVLRWGFIVFLFVVVVGLFIVIPSRDAHFSVGVGSGIALGATGLATGMLSGLLGVGGGTIMVPVLMMGFGTSDLVAKGTSLVVIIPTAASGTLGNLRRQNVDLVAAGLIGLSACVTTTLGSWIATLVSPLVGNILFAIFVFISASRMTLSARAKARAARAGSASSA